MRPNSNKFTAEKLERLVKIVSQDETIPLKALAEILEIKNKANVHYHIRRLESRGIIQWQGTVGNRRRPEGANRKRSRYERGDVKLPKLSAARQAELINQVVEKAQGSGKAGEEFVGEDVVRIARGNLFRNDLVRASRIG